MFFYVGFLMGTALCAMAPTLPFPAYCPYIVTGIFGGVIGSISFAIITDIFKMEVRGRVMGFVQMAFAASQILGIPIGLLLANNFGWHSPFWMIVGFGIVLGAVIMIYMKPVTTHLLIKNDRNPFTHLAKTVSHSSYLLAFLATTLLATGGFMLMPFASAFSTHNLGISLDDLPVLYGITGIFSILFGPIIGKLSDRYGKYTVFLIGSILTMIMVVIHTNLGITPFAVVCLINVLMFAGVSSRMISTSALMTAIPQPQDRGAFMSINASVQQIAGGVGSAIAGIIVVQTNSGFLEHYSTLGYVVVGATIITIIMMYFVNKMVLRKKCSCRSECTSSAESVNAPVAVEATPQYQNNCIRVSIKKALLVRLSLTNRAFA